MAKLSAHGIETGRIVYLLRTKVYMSDGAVLSNWGDGWKVSGKIKPGFTPLTAYESALARQTDFLRDRPEFARYRTALHDIAPQSKRYRLHTVITMMPTDADGVWSECCDGYGQNVSADVDEIHALCNLYLASVREQNSRHKVAA